MMHSRWLIISGIFLVLLNCQCTSRTPLPAPNSSPPVSRNQSIPEHYKSPDELMAQHRSETQAGIYLHKIIRGDSARRWIALTFDDGPHPDFTPRLIEILNRYRVRATFFVVGKMAEKYPSLIRALQAAGHEIGNHTYDHINLTKLPEAEIEYELNKGADVVRDITGQKPILFRPPGGDYNEMVAKVAQKLGYWLVLWTDDPGDYANPPEAVLEERLYSRIRNGGIILLHDGAQETVDLLPQLIERLQKQDYEIVPVGAMMKANRE